MAYFITIFPKISVLLSSVDLGSQGCFNRRLHRSDVVHRDVSSRKTDTTGGWPSSPSFLGLLNTSVLNGFESNTHLSTCFFPLKTVEILDLFVGFEKRLVIVKTQSFNNMPCKLTLLLVLFRQSSPHFSVPWIKPNFWGLEGKHPHWEAIRQGGPLPRAIQHPGKATILRYYTYIYIYKFWGTIHIYIYIYPLVI